MNFKPKDFLNHVTLSYFFAGNRTSITKGRVPKKYREKIHILESLVFSFCEKIIESDKRVKKSVKPVGFYDDLDPIKLLYMNIQLTMENIELKRKLSKFESTI